MDAADAGFQPLGAWLDARAIAAAPPLPEPEAAVVVEAQPYCADMEVVREVKLFRARLEDALETARTALLRELACAVLGRELLLAPAEVAGILAHLLAAHPAAAPVRLRVAADDRSGLHAPVPVIVDPALAAGDAILEFAHEAVDARLGVRLATVLAAWT